jgi:RNA polymerase II subunit A C-terminal domain phosphatase
LKEFNWDDVDAEYKEFMADVSSSDDDADGDRSTRGDEDDDEASGEYEKENGHREPPATGTKRKKPPVETSSEVDDPTGSGGESALAKKLRLSRERPASGLRAVQAADDAATVDTATSSLPTPQITGDEEEDALLPLGHQPRYDVDEIEEVDVGDEDLLAELEAEEAGQG